MKKNLLLLGIIVAGLLLRLCSINYGLPYVVGPDETRQVLDALSMGSRMSLIPVDFAYPALHKYLLLIIYGMYFVFGKIFGIFADSMDFAYHFLSQPYSFYLLARILSAIVGTLVIYCVYRTAKLLYGFSSGIIAATLVTFNFHMTALSYWVSPDILLVLCSSLALFFIIKAIRKNKLKDFIWAALFTGLAISSKFQGIMLVIPLFVALLLSFKGKRLLTAMLISAIAVFLISLLGNLQYIVKYKDAILKFTEIMQASQVGISSAAVFKHSIFGAILWYFKQLIIQDGLIGLIFCLGAAYSLVTIRRRENIIFLSLLAAFFILFSRSSLRYIYYGAFIFPVLAIVGSGFLSAMFKARELPLILCVGIIVIFSAADILQYSFKRTNLDTRQIAKKWIEDNIPKAEVIAVDWYELNVPLYSDVPFMMRTGNALNFYEKYIPQQLRIRFQDFILKDKKHYDIIQVLHAKDKGFWPPDMPPDAIKKAEEFKIADILYRRFNLTDVNELKQKGAKYLIISSYSYSHFLLDDDPYKTELYNPYFKENTVINNRQAEQYNPRTKEGTLFFLAKRARDFYLPVLYSKRKDLALLKEFKPDKFNLGPVIKIYQIN